MQHILIINNKIFYNNYITHYTPNISSNNFKLLNFALNKMLLVDKYGTNISVMIDTVIYIDSIE